MRKIMIIGCPGSGKSTFARALRDKLGLPLYYLDMLYHKPDVTTLTREEFDRALAAIMQNDAWVIDGNYMRTIEPRLQQCDTVFFLDYPVEVCLSGVEERIGKPREDMPWVEQEFDEEFRRWITDFSTLQRPKIMALLEKYAPTKQVIVFTTRAQANEYLMNI